MFTIYLIYKNKSCKEIRAQDSLLLDQQLTFLILSELMLKRLKLMQFYNI